MSPPIGGARNHRTEPAVSRGRRRDCSFPSRHTIGCRGAKCLSFESTGARVIKNSERARKTSSNDKADSTRATWRSKAKERHELHRHLSAALHRLLEQVRVPMRRRATAIAEMARTNRQAAYRWLMQKGTALPDLLSFARLARQLGSDADLLLGISGGKRLAGSYATKKRSTRKNPKKATTTSRRKPRRGQG